MRTHFLPAVLLLLASSLALRAGETIDPKLATSQPGESIQWYDARLLGIEGQGWTETKDPFDRLPAKAEGVVRAPVWNLSRNSTGLCVRFVTEATAIHARWSLTSPNLAMPHMPATGVSGLDLYVKSDSGWKWLANGRPTQPTNSAALVNGLPAGRREYLLYFPLYNGVKSVEIGLPKDVSLVQGPPRPAERKRPILF